MLHEYMCHQNNPFNQIIMGLTISADISFIILTKLSIYHTCTSKSKQRSFFFFKDKYIFNIRLRGFALILEPVPLFLNLLEVLMIETIFLVSEQDVLKLQKNI